MLRTPKRVFQLDVAVETAETELRQSPPAVSLAIGGGPKGERPRGEAKILSISTNDCSRGWGAKYAALFGDLRVAKERAKTGRQNPKLVSDTVASSNSSYATARFVSDGFGEHPIVQASKSEEEDVKSKVESHPPVSRSYE